ncbi:MAG TPA: hypothetical protein VJ986_03585 [Gaiellaceae bacterium]|nr:hypothetical protein [Gaiellaceae bacterium]
MTKGKPVPVVWAENGGAPVAGSAVLAPERLQLEGGSRDEPRSREIRFADVVSVHIGRKPSQRVGGRAAVQLELDDGSTVALAGFAATMLHELAEVLWVATGTHPEPNPETA